MIDWVVADGYGLLDVNVFPSKLQKVEPSPLVRAPYQSEHRTLPKGSTEAELLKRLVMYVWDNYIE